MVATNRSPGAGWPRRLPRRLRIVLTTRPLAYWTLTALIAGMAGALVMANTASAERVRAGFGTRRSVVVATVAIAPGELLGPHNTERRELPVAVVATGVLSDVPAGARASAAIAAGEPLHTIRVSRGGDGPIAALLPDGTRGVAVPVDERSLPLQPGERVDVVAAVATGAGGAARVVAQGASVAFVGEGVVVVAVDVAALTSVAQALADGGVVLALSAGR